MSSEHQEQVALFEWAGYARGALPELDLLYAVPNGGLRHKAVAAKMKAEGARAGVPDICLPVPRGGYHSLYIEMKYGKNKPTEKQAAWLKALTDYGHYCKVCYGFEEAKGTIELYLEMAPTPTQLDIPF